MNLENKIRSFMNPTVDESTYPGLGRSSESESPMQGSSEKPQINQLIKGAGSDASVKAGAATTLSAKSSSMDKTNPKQGSSKDASKEELDTDAPGKTASAKMKKAAGLPGHGAGKALGFTTVADPSSVVGQSSSKGNVYKEEEEYDVDDLITEEEYDALSDEEKAEYDEVELVEDFDDEDMYEIDEDDLITEEEYDALSDEEKEEYDFVELEERNLQNKARKNAFVRKVGFTWGTKPGTATHRDKLTTIGRDILKQAPSENQRKMRREDVEQIDEISNATMKSYVSKATAQTPKLKANLEKSHSNLQKVRGMAGEYNYQTGSGGHARFGVAKREKAYNNDDRKFYNRNKGIKNAMSKMKEDVESMDEANAANKAAKNAFVKKVGQSAGAFAKAGTMGNATQAGRNAMRPQPHDSKIDSRDYKRSGAASFWKKKGIGTGMQKEDLDRDMSSLFSEENNLSEEFMTKAASLFEAAVTARVEYQVQNMEEIFADAVVETVTEIEEELTHKVDAYLSYVAEQWLAQNELAVVESLRTEITEDFISGLKNLFAENFIDVPEEKYDIIGEMSQSIEQLEASVNEQMEVAISLNNELIELKRASVLAWVTEGLAKTEVEKFASLVEDVSFENESSFAEKLTVLKNNYFPNAPIIESLDSESSESDSLIESDSSVLKYAKAIGRTTFSK